MKTKRQLMQLFLDRNYITLQELAKKFEIPEATILDLENSQCIPGYTYEMRNISIFTCAGIESALTENTSIETTRYYHTSVKNWVKLALSETNLSTLASQTKDNFKEQLEKTLKETKTPGCQSFDQAWAYWIDGTWGKCLKTISVECLAKKELARKRISELMEYKSQEIQPDEKIELADAVKVYIASSLDFDTYGMRHMLAEEAIEKFELDIVIDKQYFS